MISSTPEHCKGWISLLLDPCPKFVADLYSESGESFCGSIVSLIESRMSEGGHLSIAFMETHEGMSCALITKQLFWLLLTLA